MRISISSLKRAESCPASTVLPTTGRAFADAARGTALHAEEESAAPAGSRAEVAYAYDVASGTARELGQGLGRDYIGLSPTEIPGTTDLVTVEPARVVVDDHKSGVGYQVEPAAENLQLHSYALCAARVHKKDKALVRLNFVDQGRKDEHELDALDLAATGRRIRAIWDEAMRAQAAVAQGKEPRVVAGDHCWRCPCIARCPAHVKLALTVATGSLPAELPVLELSRDAIAVGWPKVKAFKKLLGEVERTYRAFAAGEPVPLGDGRWLGPVSSRTEELDAMVVDAVLTELHGDKVAAIAVEKSTSKAAIERAVATFAPKGSKAKLVRQVLDHVAAAGGVKEKFRNGIEEYKEEETNVRKG